MKRFLSFFAALLTAAVGFAQDVDNFEIGPYEVEYRGPGDYDFRLRKGVNLYEYFELAKDTIIHQTQEAPITPVISAFQLNVTMGVPLYLADGTSVRCGVDGSWKHKLAKYTYLNAGLSFNLVIGQYGLYYKDYINWKNGHYSEILYEIGVPLAIEIGDLVRERGTMFGSFGFVPTFYAGGKDPQGADKYGLYIAPRIEVGGYVPAGKYLIRMCAFAQYNINCTSGGYDIYKERVGRTFLGGTFGLIF